MTEIEKKALALVNEVECVGWLPHEVDRIPNFRTICRAIEQHETFRQEVSDAVVAAKAYYEVPMYDLSAFIIPKPVDPLVEVMNEMGFGWSKTASEEFRNTLAQRGGKIVWGEG